MRPTTFISVRLQPHRSREGKMLRPFCGYICTGEEMWALPGTEGLRPALPPQRCTHGKGYWNSGAVITLARHMAMQYLGHLCRPLFCPEQTYRGSQDQLRALWCIALQLNPSAIQAQRCTSYFCGFSQGQHFCVAWTGRRNLFFHVWDFKQMRTELWPWKGRNQEAGNGATLSLKKKGTSLSPSSQCPKESSHT